MSILFTQYLRPDGRTREITIDRSQEIEDKARKLRTKGFRFEIEELQTGDVSMTIEDDEDIVAMRVCPNGPAVLENVDAMVLEASEK